MSDLRRQRTLERRRPRYRERRHDETTEEKERRLYRASENAEGGDCWVSQLKLRRHALNIDARLGESAGLLCFRGSRDYSETIPYRGKEGLQKDHRLFLPTLSQLISHRALPERSLKNDDRKREDPHRASETAAQREARLADRPEFSTYTLPA